MITKQANAVLSTILNHPDFIHSFLSVQYHLDGGCTLTFYTGSNDEYRWMVELYPDGSLSSLLKHDCVVAFSTSYPLIQQAIDKLVDCSADCC